MEGKVRWFNTEKGWGFIESGGKDYFAHFKQIVVNGYRNLEQGQEVTFSPGTSPKGNVALNIIPVGSSVES